MHPISPVDGRYHARTAPLARWFSEQALARARCEVEGAWLVALDDLGLFPPVGAGARARLDEVLGGFDDDDFARIKEIEARTRHDVKACELFLRERLPASCAPLLHLGLTSADVNNLAWSLLFRDYLAEEQLPRLRSLMRVLLGLVESWSDAPFPAHTHGQLASPTTAGKELAVFLHRLLRLLRSLDAVELPGKLAGATGTWSALYAAFPSVDWVERSRGFVAGLGLRPNLVVTQVEDGDGWAAWLNLVRQVNNVLLDLDRDAWSYISRGYFVQRPASGQVGSSTMPHKVNPIRFENSEGNLDLSTALLSLLADRLCRSRMQRDLSGSTVVRNIGVALAHHHLAVLETTAGLEGIALDRERCLDVLDRAPQLLAEPIQTILRAAGVHDPYELLRERTQGREVTRDSLVQLVEELDVDPTVKARVRGLRVRDYLGAAPLIARRVAAEARTELED